LLDLQKLLQGELRKFLISRAFYVEKDTSDKFKITERVSASLGELYAIYFAIKLAHTKDIKKLAICTDSLVACQPLGINTTTNFLVAKIQNELDKLTFQECPSHTGILFNKKANLVTKKACVR